MMKKMKPIKEEGKTEETLYRSEILDKTQVQ